MIDDIDFEKISQFNWNLQMGNNLRPYARTCINHKRIFLQNLILKCPEGMTIDHRNGNSLDNRRDNLRICTKEQNMANQTGWNKTKLKGTRLHHTGKYSARVYHNKKDYWLGLFDTEQEAADAYDKKAEELFGEFAFLNRDRHLYVNPLSFYDKELDPKFGYTKEGFQKRLTKNVNLNLAYL